MDRLEFLLINPASPAAYPGRPALPMNAGSMGRLALEGNLVRGKEFVPAAVAPGLQAGE